MRFIVTGSTPKAGSEDTSNWRILDRVTSQTVHARPEDNDRESWHELAAFLNSLLP